MGHFVEEKRRKWIMQEGNGTKSEKLEQEIKVPCTKCSLNVIKELCYLCKFILMMTLKAEIPTHYLHTPKPL